MNLRDTIRLARINNTRRRTGEQLTKRRREAAASTGAAADIQATGCNCFICQLRRAQESQRADDTPQPPPTATH